MSMRPMPSSMPYENWQPVTVDMPAYRQWFDEHVRSSCWLFEDDVPCDMWVDGQDDKYYYIRQRKDGTEAIGWIPRQFVTIT